MNRNKKELSEGFETTAEEVGNSMSHFGSLSPMQQERVITKMHTIGSKQEMRRSMNSIRNVDSGRIDML